MGVCNCSMFCCTLLYVHSSIAIILMGKRKLVALLNLSSWCLVMVERLFLAVPRGCLRFVIVVFPDHTHLLFLNNLGCNMQKVLLCLFLEGFQEEGSPLGYFWRAILVRCLQIFTIGGSHCGLQPIPKCPCQPQSIPKCMVYQKGKKAPKWSTTRCTPILIYTSTSKYRRARLYLDVDV